MKDKEILRIAPKGVNLKPFNDAFKDGQGYEWPEGAIYGFNNVALQFDRVFQVCEIVKSEVFGADKLRKADNPEHIQFLQDCKDTPTSLKMTLQSKYGTFILERETRLNEIYTDFLKHYKAAIYEGRIGIFRRLDEGNDGYSAASLTCVSFQELDPNGFLFSVEEFFTVLKAYKEDKLTDTKDKRFADALAEKFEEIFSLCTDHSKIKYEPVNAPVPASKLVKTTRPVIGYSVQSSGASR